MSLLMFLLTLLSLSCSPLTSAQQDDSEVRTEDICSRLPMSFPFKKDLLAHTYNSTEETLYLDLVDLVYKFCDDVIYSTTRNIVIKLDLVSTRRRSLKNNRCPSELDTKSKLQRSVFLEADNPVALFDHVQGRYFLRFSLCPFGLQCHQVACSRVIKLDPEAEKDESVCSMGPTNVSETSVRDSTQLRDFHTCSMLVDAIVPLCSAATKYSRARVYTVEVSAGEVCSFEDFFASGGSEKFNSTVRILKTCSATTASGNCSTTPMTGLLRHELHDLSRNSSFCLFYQLQNPHCHNPGDLPCFFYAGGRSLSCEPHQLRPLSLFTEPVFIGVVSATLFISLALLMWTVVQCSRKRPGTPIMPPPMKKPPPRSLTEDDLEHISRLPSQEIVLVYFPDTKRFKELNRRFRNWLVTLNVNDVKDIYDEKCSEDVLKDPEGWVRETLGGPEKRIILVCSRLAYECLATVKKGISSPKFVETDPHFGLLTRAIMYLDREMRGNYRNLICVRYEDLKICDRQYSSEAFNIVPGTEYVLPQHLEDVYRWIHPIDTNPECWSERRLEVRELLDSMRKYRLQDDNLFAVQFATSMATPTTPTAVEGGDVH
jgi:hypothetical protein